MTTATKPGPKTINKLKDCDRPGHGWYRMVGSFPPDFVRNYLAAMKLKPGSTVLDPYAGTGTTVLEAKRLGYNALGLEALPVPIMASRVKTYWGLNPKDIYAAKTKVITYYAANSQQQYLELPTDAAALINERMIDPSNLHKCLCLRNAIFSTMGDPHRPDPVAHFLMLALANVIVNKAGNIRFAPSLTITDSRGQVNVMQEWITALNWMVSDLKEFKKLRGTGWAHVYHGDARTMQMSQEPYGTVDAVITSPPYPTESQAYDKITRLESVVLGLWGNKQALDHSKDHLLRSHSRAILTTDSDGDALPGDSPVFDLAAEVERNTAQANDTSGFGRQYPKVITNYFGGMHRHLEALADWLTPGAQLVYLLGDQCGYHGTYIDTANYVAQIGDSLGYKIIRTDIFRTRKASRGGHELHENALIMKWTGQRHDQPLLFV